MLVDFGRAVDLESAKPPGTSVMEVKLVGEATCKEMMCVAMRQGLPWSFDLDTFGICASVHVLLFGQHMELQRLSSSRWMPKQPFKRYFKQDLWTRIFDKLLNIDELTKMAIDSRPASLRLLREQVEDYLTTQGDDLRAALRYQATLLPERRQDLM
jgi:checkpoint serine/threonine-protein kinase